jgi:3-hydroxyacyl-CoA dehydrogenase
MSRLLGPDTLVATNSSTLHPSAFVVRTWAMNYADVIAHPGMCRETLTEITEFAIEIGAIAVREDSNASVAEGWVLSVLNAAQGLVANGVATFEEVDRTYLLDSELFSLRGG